MPDIPTQVGSRFFLPFFINQTDLLAPVAQDLYAPQDGFIEELHIVVQAAVTTGGDVTVNINGTPVAGLSITVPDGAAKGVVYADTPNAPSATRRFKKGDRISIVPSAPFNTAGALNGQLMLRDSATQSA